MNILRRVHRFLFAIDVFFSLCFLNSAARSTSVLWDKLNARLRRLVPVSRYVEIQGTYTGIFPEFHLPSVDLIDRSRNGSAMSLGVTFPECPSVLLDIIKKHENEIVKFLGSGFYLDTAIYFRNLNINSYLHNYDVYSNVWHTDSADGERLLHLFLLTEDVGQEDGPLEYIPASNVATIFFSDFKDRSFLTTNGIEKSIPGSVKFVGLKGSYLFMNPAYSVHRATIPNGSRSILNVTLYPSWRKPHLQSVRWNSNHNSEQLSNY